ARLQAAADSALRAGLIRYERDHAGWRGPVDRIDPKGNWEARFAKIPVPAVATDVGWQLAVVTRNDRDGAAIGFKGVPLGTYHFLRCIGHGCGTTTGAWGHIHAPPLTS